MGTRIHRCSLSSGYSEAEVTVAWHLPLTTLCTSAVGEDCSDAGAAEVVVERETPNAGAVGAFAGPEEG